MGKSQVIVGIDPGDQHVGYAVWDKLNGIRSRELTPNECCGLIESGLPEPDVLVIEEFRLYPDKAGAQSWSPMLTAELIGALKWIAKGKGTPVVLQPAYVKIPTARRCTAQRLEWKVLSGHASDARLHCFHYLLRQGIL